tara:strand:+ start:5452 stop:6969 length:1518 start_codon:yes stop_codon:yes gene_type:complete
VTTGFTGLLTALVAIPAVGALIIVLFIRRESYIKLIAGAVTVIELILSIVVFALYDTDTAGYQLVDRFVDWIPVDRFPAEYFLGVDGLSAPMVLLTGLLGMVSIFASWNIRHRVKEYFFWLLLLQTSVMGVFTSLDFFLFFLFWELELVPMFFLISIWGSGRKEYSAMKFLIFTILGGALMLVGILALFVSTGTFDMTLMLSEIQTTIMPIGIIFWLFFIAFAVKLPVWPLHSWLPDAHTDAPTAASVMLAGVLLKMGGYGMIRISAGMFPEEMSDVGWIIVIAGVINVLYGALITLRQTDLKRLIAFSSISHMGFVLVGLSSVVGVGGVVSPIGLTGASLQLFTHGTITGLLFLLVGYAYEKAHTRYIPDLGGLTARMPVLACMFILAGMASLGLPGTSGFVSEITIFMGTFEVWGWPTAFAAFGVVLTAGYILWLVQRIFFGPQPKRFSEVGDISALEAVPVIVLVAAILSVGIYPAFITDVFVVGLEPITHSFKDILMAGSN